MQNTDPVPSPLNGEDQRKLHAVITQIDNQRFLLTTTAITVFGAFSAFMIPRALTPEALKTLGPILFVASTFLVFFFLLLMIWNLRLLDLQVVFAEYLKTRKSSQWEADCEEYYLLESKEGRLFLNLNIYGFLYFALGVLGSLWPIAVSLAANIALPSIWVSIHVLACITYFASLYRLGRGIASDRKRIQSAWRRVIHQHTPDRGSEA